MTNTKFTNAAIVIGVLMLLVLPVCAVAPTITSTSPGRWENGTDLNIYIEGTYFPFPASGPDKINVTLNQSPLENLTALGITYTSTTRIIASFGVKSIHFGDWNVTVINMSDNSNGTASNALSVYNNPPTLTSISPEWGLNNSAAEFFNLIGTGFFGTPVVNLSSVGITPNVNITATNCQTISSTHISGYFDLSKVGATAGQWTVNLTNPDGNLSTSTLPFTIWCPSPTIASNTQSGDNSIVHSPLTFVVRGTNYRSGAMVNITNGSIQIPTHGFTVDSSLLPNRITLFADTANQRVGFYNITVINPGPLYNNTTSVNAFQLFYSAAPYINSVDPITIANTSNISGFQIFGTGFKDNAVVVLNQTGLTNITATSVDVNTENLITCNLTTKGAPTGIWKVIVTNNDTQASNTDKLFTITSPPVPVASFNAAPISGIAPLNVQFNDTSVNDPVVWNWSFGDGQWYNTTTFANRNVTHQYTIVGTYNARLTVSNAIGSSTTIPGTTITVLKNDKIGLFRNGTFFLASNNTGGGGIVNAFIYGQAGDLPVVGNWAGTGTTTPGVFRNGIFYLRNTNTGGAANTVFNYGQAGDKPIAGHWTGVGSDTVGVFRDGTFFLASSNTPGGGSVNTFIYGQPGDVAVAGDWTGSGTTTIGVFRNGVWYLKYSNTGGVADTTFTYGMLNDKPVVGDWNGDGITEVGIYRGSNGLVALAGSNIQNGGTSTYFIYGQDGDLPVGGYWG